jgi:EF hand
MFWRYLAAGASILLLLAASIFVWRGRADAGQPIPPAPLAAVGSVSTSVTDYGIPLAAEDRTREEKRFDRYDHDRNGAVARDEFFANRRKGFVKLDANNDGILSFDEYALKTTQKFQGADKDRNGALNRVEFAITRVIRKPEPKANCRTPLRAPAAEPEASDG